jgi:hypothetical protein
LAVNLPGIQNASIAESYLSQVLIFGFYLFDDFSKNQSYDYTGL